MLFHSADRYALFSERPHAARRAVRKKGKARRKPWPAARRKAQQPLDNITAGRKFAGHVRGRASDNKLAICEILLDFGVRSGELCVSKFIASTWAGKIGAMHTQIITKASMPATHTHTHTQAPPCPCLIITPRNALKLLSAHETFY